MRTERRLVLLAGLSLGLWNGIAASADPSASGAPPLTRPASGPAGRPLPPLPTKEALAKELAELDLADVTLEEAMAFFRDSCRLNLSVRWEKLAAAGIEKTQKVAVRVKNITCSRALQLVLRDCETSAKQGGASVRFQVQKGIVVVSTRQDLMSYTEERTFNIQPLIASMMAQDRALSRAMAVEQVLGVVRTLVGEIRVQRDIAIKERNGRLVATYNPETLAAIAEVLSLISQVPKAPPPDKVEKAMMGTAKEADFDGKPLTDVMKSLRTAHDLNIHVNWRALGSVGVKPETPVTVHLRNAKLAAVIRKVLDVASPDQPLDYVVDGGVVIISRRADLDTQFVTRVYNIRRMLPTDARRAKAIDKIATTITGTIAPETWKIAFMSEINGLLLVTNCPRAHAGIAELLKQMSQRK